MYLNKLGLEWLDFIQKTRKLGRRWALIKTVMNILVSYKDGNFLVISATDFFAGRALPQGVVYFVI
jgi:hypothetical protein